MTRRIRALLVFVCVVWTFSQYHDFKIGLEELRHDIFGEVR